MKAFDLWPRVHNAIDEKEGGLGSERGLLNLGGSSFPNLSENPDGLRAIACAFRRMPYSGKPYNMNGLFY